MATSKIIRRRSITLGAAAVLVAGALTAVPTAALAAGGEVGTLGIRSTGTVYSAANSIPVIVTTAGTAATFTFEVLNTGSTTSQYNLSDSLHSSCDPSGCPTPALSVATGSLNVTTSMGSTNGYFTAPIAAGKAATYTMKLTPPKTAVPDNLYEAVIYLSDSAQTFLAVVDAVVEIKTTTGTSDDDQFISSGGSTVRSPGNPYNGGLGVSGKTLAVGQSATYTVKLQNDSAASDQIGYHIVESRGCQGFFKVGVKAGTTDVSALALAGTYLTPVLAHGKSTTLTVTITLLSSPDPCAHGDDQWESISSSGADQAIGFLVANIAVGA